MAKLSTTAILAAARTVNAGGLVVYPTDTVYGLGCDPFNVGAVKRVFRAKGRGTKALPILAASLKDAERVAFTDELAHRAASRLWPGPVTLVLRRRPSLPAEVTCGLDSVGVRVPNHPAALELIRQSGGLLVGTSANLSGAPPPRSAEEAIGQLGDRVDMVLDGGPAPLGVASTVLSLVGKRPAVVRQGPVSAEEIAKVLGANVRLALR